MMTGAGRRRCQRDGGARYRSLDGRSGCTFRGMRKAKGTIRVFTFKDGLLSAVAHDLQIRLEQFAITLDGENVTGEFALKSLRSEERRVGKEGRSRWSPYH